MFVTLSKLVQKKVLGINQRNADYILKYNPRPLYPLVDDKLLTKKLAIEAGMNVPQLYGVIEVQHQRRELATLLNKHSDFVIKPACGSGGNGILVIQENKKDKYRKPNGMFLTEVDLKFHVSNIISGMYSLGGHPDKAIIEYRIQPDPVFESISYQGVPDIRIIVFLGVPVMSMVRLPTFMSDGKANLHQGAIGAGIDIGTGKTLSAVYFDEIIYEHPNTGNSVVGIQIPEWDKFLNLATRCYELTGLGYQGVDIVLDKNYGPMILELNARPGLNIQIANNVGLLERLEIVEKNWKDLKSASERIDFAKKHFKV
ncbi:MAG: alpha-L-glutamate ligase-like protein [Leptospiraceae bacterium]|nr:alpha-L-glutamate ligase-like protein [Leptospiraceae bacterium]MCP5496851.1 alpha-L-glutamate ligase-like protein [Leptospiraceae bacterium]